MNDRDTAKRDLAAKGKAYTAAKVGGRDVILNTFKDRQEKYGRWLAVIYCTGDDGAWHNPSDEFLAASLAVPRKGYAGGRGRATAHTGRP